MIKIFKSKQEAQEFSDAIHKYLLENCPNYNAGKWQEPTPNKDATLFYVQVPLEYDVEEKQHIELYPVKEAITVTTKTQADKATATDEKVPVDWVDVIAIKP